MNGMRGIVKSIDLDNNDVEVIVYLMGREISAHLSPGRLTVTTESVTNYVTNNSESKQDSAGRDSIAKPPFTTI